ncbi:MAG: MFS transporter [Spirochaetia bacterium]|jgi:MFS family permease|nr:MFS transporter [Spirochaetia bacterium]
MNNRNIYLLYLISLLQGMVFYGPIATLYRQAAGLSMLQIMLIESCFMASSLTFELPWGIVADEIGYKNSMVICTLLFFITKIIFYYAHDFWFFLLERILLGFVFAGLSGLDTTLLYLSCKQEKAQKTFGTYDAFSTAGQLFASIVFALFIKDDFAKAASWTIFPYGLATILSVGIKEPKHTDKCKSHIATKKIPMPSPKLLLLLLAVALFDVVHQNLTVFFSQLQYLRCNATMTQIGICHALVTLSGMLGICSYRLTARFGKRRTSSILLGLAGFAAVIQILTVNLLLSVIAVVLLRVSYSLFMPLQTDLQHKEVRSSERTTALSVNAFFMDAIDIPLNLLYGKLGDLSLISALCCGAISSFSAVAFLQFYFSKSKKQ